MAIGDLEHLIGHDVGMRIADPLRRHARREIIHRLIGQHADRGVDQRGVHITTLAGALAPLQRGENADHRIDAGENVRDRNARAGWFTVGSSGQRHEPADALRHQIVASAARMRAGLAETGDGTVDETRTGRREARIVEPEFLQAADLEVLDQHIGLRRKLTHDAFAVLALEIAFDRALATVGRVEIGSAEIALLAFDERRSPSARIVTGLLALDLDDVRAEVGEQLSGPRAGENAGQFQHANAGQRAWLWIWTRTWTRTWHGQLPPRRMRGIGRRNARCVA